MEHFLVVDLKTHVVTHSQWYKVTQKTNFYHKILLVISGKFYFIDIYLRYTGYYISCPEAASGLWKVINERWGVDAVVVVISWFPPQMFLFHNVTIVHPEDFTQCTTRGSFVRHWHETAYNMFTFFCLFLLPLVIMITCYTRIFCEISKRLRKDNRESKLRLKLCGSVEVGDYTQSQGDLIGTEL